jgi:UDP-2,4-diacetamido-2,4,6-trideoxy-beta-L-altropyranose hydrolase
MIAPGPLLAIRADASHQQGTGHIMRTLAIAQIWLERGGQVIFLCAQIPPVLEERLTSTGARVQHLGPDDDAAETTQAVETHRAVTLLVDHYDLSGSWWHALPTQRRWKTAAINDFTSPIHTLADLRISPRATPLAGDPLSGPAFLLIRSELRRLNPQPAQSPPSASNILLVLGGADPQNAGPVVAAAILAQHPDVSLRAIVGPAAANLHDFKSLATRHPKLEVVNGPPTMRAHYEWADTAIVSPSTTAFEALHHALPTGLVITADNQEEVGHDLCQLQAAIHLADARSGGPHILTDALRVLLRDEPTRHSIALRGAQLVDGGGAGRFCDLLGLPEITFRPATLDDAEITWDWANDPVSRAASFNSDPISWENHQSWFTRQINSPQPPWIILTGTDPVGLIRFDPSENQENHTISINLAPAARGRGWAALALARASSQLLSTSPDTTILAWIKPDNHASRSAFLRAGFRIDERASLPDRLLYTFPA